MRPVPLMMDSMAQRTNELNQIESLRQGIQGYGKTGVNTKTVKIPPVDCAIALPPWALSMSRMRDAHR
jgi:accessory colonization factor AcfC